MREKESGEGVLNDCRKLEEQQKPQIEFGLAVEDAQLRRKDHHKYHLVLESILKEGRDPEVRHEVNSTNTKSAKYIMAGE